MFGLFTRPAVLRRHKEGPLAVERARCLTDLAAKSVARTTLLRRASCCRRVAVELQQWPSDRCFDKDEVEEMAPIHCGRPDLVKHAAVRQGILPVCDDRFLTKSRPPAFHSYVLAGSVRRDVVRIHHPAAGGQGLSEVTRRTARWQLTVFLDHLERRGMLEDVGATDIDAFYAHMALRWGRNSLHRSATVVRAWFRYCCRASGSDVFWTAVDRSH